MFRTLIAFAFLLVSITGQSQDVDNFNLKLISNLPYPEEINDVWGYVDETGIEYALVGEYFGFSIVNLDDPYNPVEVFDVGGFGSTWRDIKTWGDYAYVTCESPTKLLIVDMSPLPGNSNLQYTYWSSPDTMTFSTAHNLYIDDNGFAYIFGANYEQGGAIILDLKQDPMNPTPVGLYDVEYLHDGMVRNDTLWGGAVYDGDVHVIDVSDKANPTLLSTWKTPSAFTHNMWISDDGKHLFTTDEVRNGSIGAYNVENILNPIETDVWMPNDTGIVPHNTHFMNDYLITSHYTIGLSILDVSRPNNMVEVGRFDTSPDYLYEGFHGCWGAYPWLPSGLILATDIEEGLFVFEPNYQRGCYIEGTVTDQQTGNPIFYPTIEILGTSVNKEGSILGEYSAGIYAPGFYNVKVSKDGYYPQTVENVELVSGLTTVLDVELSTWPTSVSDPEKTREVIVAPNPVKDVLSVSSTQQFETMTLTDLSGKIIHAQSCKQQLSYQFDLSGISSGVYLLQLSGEESYKQLVVVE